MLLPLITVAIGTVSAWLGTRPELAGQPKMWLFAMLPEVPLVLLACIALGRSRKLKERLLPRRGDVFLGVASAMVLTIGTWAGRYLIMPHGSPRTIWLARLYLQLGDPIFLQRTWWIPLVLIVGSMMTEVVWRGWIQDQLMQRFGDTRGLAMTSGLYALTAVPSMFNLADPAVGTNVLLPLVAAAGGMVWGYATLQSGRATPAMVSHATFTYFVVMQFRPGL